MDNLFLALLLISIAGLLVGIIRPTWIRLDSRKKVGKIFGSGILIFFILFAVTTTPPEPKEQKVEPTITQDSSSAEIKIAEAKAEVQVPVPPKPISLEDQITQAIDDALGSKNNTGKQRVVSVKITTYNSVELSTYGYKSNDTVKGVLLTINASENLTTNLQKGTMADEASKAFQAIFPLSSQIGDVVVWSQLPVQDKYGNAKDDTAITYAMARPLYQKVNWMNLNHRDLPNLLNSESKVDDRNGSFELIKF